MIGLWPNKWEVDLPRIEEDVDTVIGPLDKNMLGQINLEDFHDITMDNW